MEYEECYDSTIDLMDERLFPRNSEYRRKPNPRGNISHPIKRLMVSDEEIVKSVSDSMKNALGASENV